MSGHDNEIEDQIFKKYGELRKEKGLCKGCNVPKDVNGALPVSFFVIGESFQEQKFRVMFVGKTVQSGWENEPIEVVSGFIDPRKYAKKELFLPFWSTTPFWQCIKEICQKLWKMTDPEDIWRRIAITNLVKCSTSPGLDTTPESLKGNCIQNAAFFENEVKIAQPTHLVLFTGLDYDDYLNDVSFGYEYRDGKKGSLCGVKLWQRDFLEANKVKLRFLRTNHPAHFMKKIDQQNFCKLIVKWIRLNPVEI